MFAIFLAILKVSTDKRLFNHIFQVIPRHSSKHFLLDCRAIGFNWSRNFLLRPGKFKFSSYCFLFSITKISQKIVTRLEKKRDGFRKNSLYFPKPPHHTNSFYFLMSINLLMIMLIMPICVYYVQRNIPVIPENVNIGHLILPRVLKFVRPAAHA